MTESEDSRRPEFWNVRYAARETPWTLASLPSRLELFLRSAKPGTVLVPGCGNGHALRAFHQAGWTVTALDFSPVAVAQAKAQLPELATSILLDDFFKHDFGGRQFDLCYERTFLCALAPELRPAYVRRMVELLRPQGMLAGFFLFGEEPDPPPYPLTDREARDLFERDFHLVRSEWVEGSLPLYEGKERWLEWVPRGKF